MNNLLKTTAVTKSSAQALGIEIATAILDGEESPVKAWIALKGIEEAIAYVKKHPKVKKYVLEEAEKEGRSFELNGAKVVVGATYTKYDFSNCGDSHLDEVNEKIRALTITKKAREAMLKVLPPEGMADPETGELLRPPAKMQTEGVKITLG